MERLLVGYDATVAELVRELDATGAGDRVTIRSYLIEPGESTERVLGAVRGALERGAHVAVAADGTLASALSRFWEGTTTRFEAFATLAAAHPARARATLLRGTDHSKYAIFERARGEPTAIVGGMNLGDRFRAWRDFAVHFAGAEPVGALQAVLRGETSSRFVANVVEARVFNVRGALEALAADERVPSLRVAMAYVDREGVAILARALRRGARVELIIPARANVYQHSNMRAATRLLALGARILACRSMVHAKAFLAPDRALVGSANLKRNSLDKFGELDAVATEPSFIEALGRAFDDLAAESDLLERPRYKIFSALVEERFG